MPKKSVRYNGVLSHINVQRTDTYVLNVKIGDMYVEGRINNKVGEVQISPDVVALYAGIIAVECFGVVDVATVSTKDRLVKLLKKESLTRGINVVTNDNRISFDLHVIMSYGVNISAASDNLIESVKYRVEEFTGMEAEKINIFVGDARAVDQGEVTCGYKYD